MTFTVNSINRCVGLNHIDVNVTVGGTDTYDVTFLRADLDLDIDDIKQAAFIRIRSAVKEAGATTPPQIQSALVGKTFKI